MNLTGSILCVVQILQVIVAQQEHAVLIVVPVVRDFVQGGLGHQRSTGTNVAPLVILQILNPALQLLNHFGTVRHEQRQALTHYIHRSEQVHLTAQTVVISVLDICQVLQILFQIHLLGVRGSVDSGEHLVVLVSSPVCTGRRSQLERLDLLGAHQVRTRTQFDEITLLIEGNGLALRQILNQLHLVRLFPILHHLNRFFPRQCKVLQTVALLDDFLHLLLDLVQILPGQRRHVEVIVESGVDGRSDGQLCLRVQVQHRLRQNVRTGVAIRVFARIGIESENVQLTVAVNHGTQVLHLTVHLAHAGNTGQTLADILRDIVDGHRFSVFTGTSVFQSNNHLVSSFLKRKVQKKSLPQLYCQKGRIHFVFVVPPIFRENPGTHYGFSRGRRAGLVPLGGGVPQVRIWDNFTGYPSL